MKPLFLPLVVVPVLSLSVPAAAQVRQTGTSRELRAPGGEPAVTEEDGPSYVVHFDDDAIAATLTDGNIPRIQVRTLHGYGMLHRPRLQFVTEMRKSVEVF